MLIISCDKTVTPEPEEPNSIFNTIVFDSEPKGFTVFINGKVTGAVTPDSLHSIDTGLVTIKISKPLYRDSIFTMKIENNKRYDLFFDILANPQMRGAIQVNSTPPGATIFFNGDSTEFLTPHKFTNLVPGQYEIYLKKEGHWDFYYPLTVQSNTTPVVNAALDDTTVWVIYDEKNIKLPINFAQSVTVDEYGHIWVGTTGEGLFRYNGIEWKNYKVNNSSLPDNSIRHIAAENNKIWISTFAGVVLYHNETFITFNSFNSPLPSDFIFNIYINNGKKYIATFAKGFAVYDNFKWEIFNYENSGIPSNSIRCFTVDNSNHLWIGTSDSGLARYDGINWYTYKINAPDSFLSNNISTLSTNHNGLLYIGFLSSALGKPGLGINNGTEFQYFINKPSANISSIKFDKNSKGWLTSFGNGVFRENSIDNYTTFYTLNSKLPVNFINDMAFDQQGNKWFATFGGGVVKYKGD